MAWLEFVILVAIATCIFALPPPLAFRAATPGPIDGYSKGPTKLLQAFGISQPGVRRWHSEPPQYMLDLYNQVADPSGLTRLPGPYGATVIRAFSEKEGSSGSTFVFSLNGLEEVEQVLEAELHIHHSRLQQAHRHLLEDNIYMLEVSAQVEGERMMLAKQQVAAHNSGWRVFQVGSWVMKVTTANTKMEQEGADGVEENIKMEEEEKEETDEEKQVVLRVIARTLEGRILPVVFHHGLRGTRRPLLILFNGYTANSDGSVSSQFGNVGKNAVMNKEYETTSLNRLRRSVDENQTVLPAIPSGCQRRNMLVDFASIGWSSWIVSPTSYNAYQCIGQCSFPLGQDLNPTNHATVQSIINHSGDFPEVQRPCCVPSTYGNLSLLYYDAEENVVLKLYDKMVAIECGCH